MKAPVVLFCVALALRLSHLATVRESPFFTRLWLDLAFFDEWAQRIAAGDWLGSTLFYQDPLYPYFLGTLYAILGHEPVAPLAPLEPQGHGLRARFRRCRRPLRR